MFIRALCVVTAFVALGSLPRELHGTQHEERRVLFIGNSLTSMNDLPRLVEELTAAGDRPIRASVVARDGFSLDDHWQDGAARKAIERGGWSFVVMQQGPSALPESRDQLRSSVRRFDAVVRRVRARSALYMVWPSSVRFSDFDRVSESYALAAADVGGLLIPAGEAWRAALRLDPAITLYRDDGFHPTPQATYLAALTMASMLTGDRASTFELRPSQWPESWLPAGRARLLRAAAVEAVSAVPGTAVKK